ncbi:hypothetical protein [Dongia sp.]|uniref:hypothetical protein n=1 Tax=Dongia sp. TaxID=1977262 RepID=UPI003753BB75
MTDFQSWNRQVLPQGGLVAPRTGPSLAESFGKGFVDLATAASGAVESIRKTDEWHDEKEWEVIDQPKAAALINDLQLRLAEQLPELKSKAAPGLADYPDLINDAVTRTTDEALRDNSNPRFQRYVRAHMDGYRVSAIESGVKDRTVARFALDAGALHDLVSGQASQVADDLGRLESATKLVDDMINGNQHFTADQKAELSRISRAAIVSAGLKGLKRRNLDAALQEVSSGKYDKELGVDGKQDLLASIEREQKLRDLEIKNEHEQANAKSNSDTLAELDRQLNEAGTKGTYDGIAFDKLKKALGSEKAAYDAIAELAFRADTHADLVKVEKQSLSEDRILLDSLQKADEAQHTEHSRRRLELVTDAIVAKNKAIQADAAEYASTTNPHVRADWDDVLAGGAAPEKVTKALISTQQELRRLGVPAESMRPIPLRIANGLQDQLRRKGNASNIAYLQRSFGTDYPHFVAALPPTADPYFATALLLEPHQGETQEILLALSRDPKAYADLERNASLTKSQKSVLESEVYKGMKDLKASYAEQPAGSTISANLERSVQALALYQVYHNQKSPAEAAAIAAQQLGAGDFAFRQFRGYVYRVPRAYQVGLIASGADEYLEQLATLPLDNTVDRETPPDRIVGTLQDHGFWVTASDESGLELRFSSKHAAKIAGKPIKVSWAELARLGMSRRARQAKGSRTTGANSQ